MLREWLLISDLYEILMPYIWTVHGHRISNDHPKIKKGWEQITSFLKTE